MPFFGEGLKGMTGWVDGEAVGKSEKGSITKKKKVPDWTRH